MKEITLDDFKEISLANRIIAAQDSSIEIIPLGYCDIKAYIFHYPAGQVKETHSHEEIRLTFIRSGRVEFAVEGKMTEVSQGDFITCHPNVPHSLKVVGDEPLHLIELVISTNNNK